MADDKNLPPPLPPPLPPSIKSPPANIPIKNQKGSAFIKLITNKLVALVASEVEKAETQALVREKIIVPVINLIYSQLYPYIIALVATITLMFILTFLTFFFLLLFYFKR
jgi:hypothetical protein